MKNDHFKIVHIGCALWMHLRYVWEIVWKIKMFDSLKVSNDSYKYLKGQQILSSSFGYIKYNTLVPYLLRVRSFCSGTIRTQTICGHFWLRFSVRLDPPLRYSFLFLGGDMNYFWKSRFWIFLDSYNSVCATPKWRDGVIVTEISEISSEIRDLNFRWESRICHPRVKRTLK